MNNDKSFDDYTRNIACSHINRIFQAPLTQDEITSYIKHSQGNKEGVLALNYECFLNGSGKPITLDTSLTQEKINFASKVIKERLELIITKMPYELILMGINWNQIQNGGDRGYILSQAEKEILNAHHSKETKFQLPITSRAM